MWHVQSRESSSVCLDHVHRMFSRHLSKHFPNGYFGHSWCPSHSLSHICSSVEKHYWASGSSKSLKHPIAVCFICDCGGGYLKIGDMSHFWSPLDSSQLWAYRLLRKTCWLIAYLEVFSGSLECVSCISVYGTVYVLKAWIHWRAQHVSSLPILKTLQSSIQFPWHGDQVPWQDVPSSSGHSL